MHMRHGNSKRSRLLGTALALALAALLAACGLGGTGGASTNGGGASAGTAGVTVTSTITATTATTDSSSRSPSASQGVIAGSVVSGGACSAADIATPCAGQASAGYRVTIQAQGGAVVATATTDAAGRFAVALTPGMYLVQPQWSAGKGLVRVIPSGPLTVRAGATAAVQIILETSGAQP